MDRFFRVIRPWLIGLYWAWTLGFVVLGVFYLTVLIFNLERPHGFYPYGILIFANSLIFLWINHGSRKPYIDEKSPYRLWERSAESAGRVAIALPADQVHQAVLEAISTDPKLRVDEQHPEVIWVSLGKRQEKAGCWMAAYLVTAEGITTLTLGIWTTKDRGYDLGRNRRQVRRIFDAITAKLAPTPLVPVSYNPGTMMPSEVTSNADSPTAGQTFTASAGQQ
ncbi:hypothetical protein [Psychromicrobium sp. YIM B11713]|uniref:hypothetical protein n=1 Tax=Psychromicrobium sp. YIM B11713 TaxID=3145233 RepID=UPI00374E82A8